MKTKIVLLAGLCLLVLASGVFTACESKNLEKGEFEIDIPSYHAELSELTDAEIQTLIDTYYQELNDAPKKYVWTRTALAEIIQVYQNELILRELRRAGE